jgi:hypothetical protein
MHCSKDALVKQQVAAVVVTLHPPVALDGLKAVRRLDLAVDDEPAQTK